MHCIVQIATVDHLSIEQAPLAPPHLPAPLLVHQQPIPQLLGLDLQEARQLLQIHRGVQLQIALDGRGPHVGLDFLHEDGEVVLDGVDVDFRVIEVRRRGRDELGAGAAEELLEDGERVRPTALHPVELLAVFLAHGGVDGVVETGGVEGDADGDERVHLVVLLRDAVVLLAGVLLEVFGTRDVDEDVAEHADGVGVAAHHHVREADIIVGGEVGGHDAGEHGFLVELNVVEGFERETKVPEETVHS